MTADRLHAGVTSWAARRHVRRAPLVGLAALTGALAALGQAPLGLWPVTVIGLVIGSALILAATSPTRAALTGWALGLGYFAVTLSWIIEPFLVDIARHGWMAPFALVLMAGGMALFWGLGAGLARRVAPARLGWLALAAGLALAELLRGWIFGGFPWGGVGQVWIDTPLAQWARLVGASGLSALTWLMTAAAVPALTRPWRAALWAGACAGLGLGGAALLPGDPGTRDVTLRLVQPNAPQELKWDPEWVMTFFDRALELSRHDGSADLVIWPETTLPAPLGRAPDLEAEAARAAAPAPLVAGVQRIEGPTWRNALVAFAPDGSVEWVYDKHHLVPFGEYVPLGNLAARFGIHGLAQQEGAGYAPGPGPMTHDLGAVGRVLPLICYEMIFQRDIRGAEKRADWILQATNDAWFGTFSGPQQHLVQARFRAIEFGLPIARAANTGISAVIDARGRIIAQLALGETGALMAALPAPLAPPPYARLGDWPLLVASLLACAALALRSRRNCVDPARSGG